MSVTEAEAPLEAPDESAAVEVEAQEPAVEAHAGPVCRVCATPRQDGQDWCLSCGTAVATPRRRPGLRSLSAATVATFVLLGGAAVASVAAINDTKPPRATIVKTIAQAAVPATTDTAPTIDPVTTPPVTVTPITPVAPVTPVATTPVTTTPTTVTPPTGGTPAKTGDTRVVLSSGSGALYDPLARANATGDPQRAIDGDPGTSWFATTPADGDMNLGYLIDLGEPTALKRLELVSKTPGMTVRVLAATTVDPPPSLDDTGWTEIAQQPSAGYNDAGKLLPKGDPIKIPLEAAGKKFRVVVVTIETPPNSGSTVRFTELRLFS